MSSIDGRIDLLKSRELFTNQMRVSEANSLFLAAQVLALASPTTKNYEKEKELREKWTFLRTIEECYFKQKSRVDWLKERDLNTAYFFRVFETRIRYNSIRCFQLTYSLMVSDRSNQNRKKRHVHIVSAVCTYSLSCVR